MSFTVYVPGATGIRAPAPPESTGAPGMVVAPSCVRSHTKRFRPGFGSSFRFGGPSSSSLSFSSSPPPLRSGFAELAARLRDHGALASRISSFASPLKSSRRAGTRSPRRSAGFSPFECRAGSRRSGRPSPRASASPAAPGTGAPACSADRVGRLADRRQVVENPDATGRACRPRDRRPSRRGRGPARSAGSVAGSSRSCRRRASTSRRARCRGRAAPSSCGSSRIGVAVDVRRQPVGDRGPGLAEVGRLPDVRLVVVHAVVVGRRRTRCRRRAGWPRCSTPSPSRACRECSRSRSATSCRRPSRRERVRRRCRPRAAPFCFGDSASAKMVQYTSTPVLSPVIGPPRPLLLLLVVARQVAARPSPTSARRRGCGTARWPRGRPSSGRAAR